MSGHNAARSARWVNRTPSPAHSPAPSPRHNVQVYSEALFAEVGDGVSEDYLNNKHLAVPQQIDNMRRAPPSNDPDDDISPEMRTQIRKQARERREAQRQKLEALRARQQKALEEEDRQVREAVQRRIKRKHQEFLRMLDRLDEEYEEIKEIEEYLDSSDAFEQRKREELYKEWERNVFRPIQKQIERKLASTSTAEIEERRRKMFEEYLQASNNNQGMFRDIIKPDQYDPMKYTSQGVKYSLKGIKDPLKKELERIKQEHAEIAELQGLRAPQGTSGSAASPGSSPRSRGGSRGDQKPSTPRMDPTIWDRLESTPHGRYSRMFPDDQQMQQSHQRQQQHTTAANANLSGNVVMDHYNVASAPATSKRELFGGGKRIVHSRANAPRNPISGSD